jgi:Na+-transporting methylmalonyl-CoA/oxaloacetate decarboxylase gamma subunit
MSENLYLALQITVAGMGLVFASLALFAGVMAVLVRVTAEPPARPEPEPAAPAMDAGVKAQAAAAAVALALAQESRTAAEGPLPPPTATVSPWQAARRANQLRQRGRTR